MTDLNTDVCTKRSSGQAAETHHLLRKVGHFELRARKSLCNFTIKTLDNLKKKKKKLLVCHLLISLYYMLNAIHKTKYEIELIVSLEVHLKHKNIFK